MRPTSSKKRPIDRRVQRSRQLLQDALIAMMMEKGYEATTVQDIIDRANVGRATFYAHFADKETLLASRLEDLRAMLAQRQRVVLAGSGGPTERSLGFSLAMIEHAGSHLRLYQSISGRKSGTYVLQRIHRMIAELAAAELATAAPKNSPLQRDLAAQYVAGAFMAVLTWWLDHGAQMPPADVDLIVRRLVTPGLTAGLRTPDS